MRCENVDCPDLRGVVVTPSEQAFLLLEENVRMLIKSGDKGQKHDSQWECAGHTLPSVSGTLCQVPVLACMHYCATLRQPALRIAPNHSMCAQIYTRSCGVTLRGARRVR